ERADGLRADAFEHLQHLALAPLLVPPTSYGRGELEGDAVAVERRLHPVLGHEDVLLDSLHVHEPEPAGVDGEGALDDVAAAGLLVLVAPPLHLRDEAGAAELFEDVVEELVALVVPDVEGL